MEKVKKLSKEVGSCKEMPLGNKAGEAEWAETESLDGSMQRSRDNNFRTKGSWKKRPFCWSLVETSDYKQQDLPLAKGEYRVRQVSEGVTEAG